jgi:UDP-4-amino-4-deoxy-L-arabinose formyltransferase/UDP-glucuronic acid dehydrogenase (UDP-4-keto-hexauronic acid decarboxylating)
MIIAIIGRTELLYNIALDLHQAGNKIACILTSKEAPEYKRTAKDFKELAKTMGIPFAQGSNIIEHYDFLKTANANIAVSINYSGIIPQSVIELFPMGILNAHGGDLPRYRGNACQAWAILNGEARIALCIHKMVGGELDSGDIIARDYLNIDFNTKITNVLKWMESRTPELMKNSIKNLSLDPNFILEKQSKNDKDILRCYPRKPEDGKIDWSKSALKILRLINASNRPYQGAFCNFEGKKLTIWEANLIVDNEIFFAVPGQITKIGTEFIEVACGGGGKLRILQVEYENNIIAPNFFINSIRDRLS